MYGPKLGNHTAWMIFIDTLHNNFIHTKPMSGCDWTIDTPFALWPTEEVAIHWIIQGKNWKAIEFTVQVNCDSMRLVLHR